MCVRERERESGIGLRDAGPACCALPHHVTVKTQLKMIANAAKTPNDAMGMIGAEAVATNARNVVADVLSTVTNVRE